MTLWRSCRPGVVAVNCWGGDAPETCGGRTAVRTCDVTPDFGALTIMAFSIIFGSGRGSTQAVGLPHVVSAHLS